MQQIATLQEMFDVVKQRNMEIDNKNLEIKEKGLEIDNLKDRLKMAVNTSIASLRCDTLQHTATHCNTLQHTATRCNTLQHTLEMAICTCMHL